MCPLVRTRHGRKLAEKFSWQSLSAKITAGHQQIRTLKHLESDLPVELNELILPEVYEALVNLKNQSFKIVTTKSKERLKG